MFSIQPLVPIACLSLSYLLNKSQFRLPIHLLISDTIKSHIPLPYLSDNVIIPYLQSSLNPVLSIAVMLHSASSLHHASYGIVNVFSITPPKSLFIPSCPLFSHSFCNARKCFTTCSGISFSSALETPVFFMCVLTSTIHIRFVIRHNLCWHQRL